MLHLGWTYIVGLLFVNLYFYIFNQSLHGVGIPGWTSDEPLPAGREVPALQQALPVACKRNATPQPVFKQKMKITQFNFKTFLLTTIVCGILTFVTLIAAAARDEGTGGNGLLTITLEKLFYIFRFPTHTLFFQFMNGSMFFIGLIINCLFYGLVTERISSFYKSKESKV